MTQRRRRVVSCTTSKLIISRLLGRTYPEPIRKKPERLKILDECKLHGGPLTPDSLNLVNELTEKQLIAEIKFLRCTTAPDIRQRRRVKVEGAYKMQKFTTMELKQSIRNAIKPESVIMSNIDELLLSFLNWVDLVTCLHDVCSKNPIEITEKER